MAEARIGPNAIIRVGEALVAMQGRGVAADVFAAARLTASFEAPPQSMVPEQEVTRLHAAMRRMLANTFEDVDDGHVPALELARQDRAAIHEHRRHVEANHRHHQPRQRLVATRESNDRVVAVPAHGEFDRIRNHVAADERRLHALVTHGNTVRHRDRAELARRTASALHAGLHRLRLAHQRDVAGRGLVPARHHADEGLRNLFSRKPHRIVVRAVRRTRRPLGDVT